MVKFVFDFLTRAEYNGCPKDNVNKKNQGSTPTNTKFERSTYISLIKTHRKVLVCSTEIVDSTGIFGISVALALQLSIIYSTYDSLHNEIRIINKERVSISKPKVKLFELSKRMV